MKKIFLLAMISCQLVAAQQVKFLRTYGFGIYDSGEGVLQASDTGYVVGGITTQSGSNGTDMLIYKTDSLGQLQWYKHIGLDNSIEGAKSIARGISGAGYLLAGYQNNYDTSGYNFYVVKTDLNGDTAWTKTYGGADWDMAYSADTLKDSTYVIAGETFSFGNGNRDMYVIRINQNGDTLWTRTFGGSEDDYANYVFVDRHNNIMLIGTTYSFGSGGSDVFIVYMDAAGDTIWTKVYGTAVDEFGYSGDMFIDNGGHLSFTFAYTQYNPLSEVQETRLFRGDSVACNLISDVSFFFAEPEILDHVRIRRDGKGRFYFTGDLRYSDNGYTDVYLHKTLYGMNFGTTNVLVTITPDSEYPHDVRKCFDKGLIVTGSTNSYGPGPTSSFILKTDSLYYSPLIPVVALDSYEEVDFSVYPNPATDHFFYMDAGKPIQMIQVYDLNGRVVQAIHGNGDVTQTVHLNNLGSGMYVVEVITNKGSGRKKLLIANN
jgi:hypothetical protein